MTKEQKILDDFKDIAMQIEHGDMCDCRSCELFEWIDYKTQDGVCALSKQVVAEVGCPIQNGIIHIMNK